MTKSTGSNKLETRPSRQKRPIPAQRLRWRPETIRPYRPPRLVFHGELGSLIRGASYKGVDSIGELDPHENYPR